MDRRTFLQQAAASAALGVLSRAVLAPSGARPRLPEPMVGIQIGAVSFFDEGVAQVLDIAQERSYVNTIFIPVMAFNHGLAGRQDPRMPLPDHGGGYDKDFQGGYWATIHSEYYENEIINPRDVRAPDLGGFDVLGSVVPEAKKRNIRVVAFMADNFRSSVPNAEALFERTLNGETISRVCINNPEYQRLNLGMVEDCLRSYDVDGLLWRSEKVGPFPDVLRISHSSGGGYEPATCFCEYCLEKARQQGIDLGRVREGYRALEAFRRKAEAGERPVDGYYVAFWRILLRHPEILVWQRFFNDNHHATLQAVRDRANAVRPDLPVGTAISFKHIVSHIHRAEQSVETLSPYTDFLKVIMYHNDGGPRTAKYIDNVTSTLFADFAGNKQLLLEWAYQILNYDEGRYGEIPHTGLSSDFVYREARRAADVAAGTRTKVWAGIDVDLPTDGEGETQCTPEGTRDAVLAAIRGGVDGVILCRKYSEMRLTNLSGAGDAIRQLGLSQN